MELQGPSRQVLARVICAPLPQALMKGNDWTAQKTALTQFTAQSAKIMPVGAAWLHQLLPPLCHYWAGGTDCSEHCCYKYVFPLWLWTASLSWRWMVVPQLIERSEVSFSPSLGPCQTHGTLTYILKILHLQFGCSWLCCALHQPPESLCHRRGDLSAGEVSHCSSLTQILR